MAYSAYHNSCGSSISGSMKWSSDNGHRILHVDQNNRSCQKYNRPVAINYVIVFASVDILYPDGIGRPRHRGIDE